MSHERLHTSRKRETYGTKRWKWDSRFMTGDCWTTGRFI